jgi:hypothetical protein
MLETIRKAVGRGWQAGRNTAPITSPTWRRSDRGLAAVRRRDVRLRFARTGFGMSAGSVLALLGAIVLCIGVMFASLRGSQRNYEQLRRVAQLSDEAMRQTASALGLQFIPPSDYEHPLVGGVAGFGGLRGVVDGISVKVDVAREGEGELARIKLSAALPSGASLSAPERAARLHDRYRLESDEGTLTLYPRLAKRGSVQFISYEVITEPQELISLLRELARLARGVS